MSEPTEAVKAIVDTFFRKDRIPCPARLEKILERHFAEQREEIERLQELLEGYDPFVKEAADRMSDVIAALVERRVINSRSRAADAALDYKNPDMNKIQNMVGLEDQITQLKQQLAEANHQGEFNGE